MFFCSPSAAADAAREPPNRRRCRRRVAMLAATTLLAGFALATAIFISWPAVYFELADRFRWRLQLSSPAQIRLETTLGAVQRRGEALANSATLLFGDSHLHGLPGSALAGGSNFAIAGETAERLARRIGRYRSVGEARRIVLLTGSNDLLEGAAPEVVVERVAAVMRAIPEPIPLLLLELPPTAGHSRLDEPRRRVNLGLRAPCAARAACRLVELSPLATVDGTLRAEYAAADGIHLSTDGYRALAGLLNDAVEDRAR